MDCIFCKIVTGDIPSVKILENENFLAFLDIAPIHVGHTLVIPKQHCKDLRELPLENAKEWLEFIQHVMNMVQKGTGCEGLNVGTNNGAAAGQVVFHQHTHVIPRFANDALESWPSKQTTPEEMKEVQKRILEKKHA